MAEYLMWAKVDSQVVNIPNEKLEGLTEEEKQKFLFDYHTKWVDSRLYGDWEEIK